MAKYYFDVLGTMSKKKLNRKKLSSSKMQPYDTKSVHADIYAHTSFRLLRFVRMDFH